MMVSPLWLIPYVAAGALLSWAIFTQSGDGWKGKAADGLIVWALFWPALLVVLGPVAAWWAFCDWRFRRRFRKVT